MERTVPRTASDEIDLYLRTIYSLLRSTTAVQIRTLEELHAGMNSSLHPDAPGQAPDMSAFIYTLLRLPEAAADAELVVLGQTPAVFAQHGYPNVESWSPVIARARRRRWFFDGKHTMACFIASRSDIDDVVPTLTAFQIEWNKLHFLLNRAPCELLAPCLERDSGAFTRMAGSLQMSVADLERLAVIWGPRLVEQLEKIRSHPMKFSIRLLGGSLSEYWRATREWWDNVEEQAPSILQRPVYFVSSNTHSLANLLSGYALELEQELVAYVEREEPALHQEWREIQEHASESSLENYLYYVLKKFQQTPRGRHTIEAQLETERHAGITRVASQHSFDLETQVIELNRLDPSKFDPRLNNAELSFLRRSDALILNIDYPLGLAAYNLLNKVAEHARSVLGVYVMGKAATMNGVLGDVMIPEVVHDEHSQNTYLFNNVFNAAHVSPYLLYGTVLDHQKGISVMGTFLQNAQFMDVFYREGFTDLEMEAGPYLSAVYELSRPKRHPINEIVNLYGAPFDIGILHYASDTPMGKGQNLGAGSLSYFGMDATYACSVTILRRIIELERIRLEEK